MTVLKRASTILVCFLVGTINGNIHVTQDTRVIEEGSCENEDYCTAEDDVLNSEQATYKYSADVQQAREIFKDTVDATREPSEEELKVILHEMEVKWPDEDESDYDIDEHLDVIGEYLEQTQTQQNGERNVIDTEASQETKSDYEFPRLVTVEPGNVGDVQIFEVDNEYVYERITMSVRPPIFEIPDFLTGEECDYIIETAKKNGLDQSNLFGAEIKDELNKNRNNSDISRVSDQTWLRRTVLGEAFWAKLNSRLSALTMLDIGIINRSEPMQVVSYVPGGHYHAHLDTVESSDLPCCFQTHCGEKEETAAWSECCRLCRYITVLYYLNDVEAGGETVFPLADMPDELYNEKMTNLPAHKWYNLSLYCHNSSLIVSPKRGTAIFWYSHFIDEQTGYLGPVDQRSHHGGCDLLKGQKWIANSWISGTTHRDRFKPVIGRLLTNEIKPHSTINLNYGYKKTFYSCSSQVYQTEWLYSVNLTLNRSATIKDYWNMYVKEADSKETWYYLENIFWAYPPNTSTDFALKYKGTIPGGNCTWSFYSLGEPTEVPEPWTENSTTFNTSTSSTVSSTSTAARTTSTPNTTDTTDPANETCLCSCPCQPKSQESIDEMMEIILYDLIIAKNSTFQAKQRLISAHDERWISRGIGFVGVLVLSLVFGSIIVGDIKLILENSRVAFRRIFGR